MLLASSPSLAGFICVDLFQVKTTIKSLFAGRPHLYDRVAVITFWPLVLYTVRILISAIAQNVIINLHFRFGRQTLM